MSINSREFEIRLNSIVNFLRAHDQPATVQIGFDGKCTLRVGYIDRGGHTSEDMTLSELAKRMDEVGEREAMRY